MAEKEDEKLLMQKIAKILDECRVSYAIHNRKLKELTVLRSASPTTFFSAFSKTLTPLFDFQRRISSAERIVRFFAIFAARRDEKHASDCDAFLVEFLRFLLIAAVASNKTARFRSCQIISEIIMRLPDDAEVSNELWDAVIDCMKIRVEDKVAAIRTFAVRALARFANDAENGDIIDLFLEALPLEQNAEVRKTIVLSLPPSNATSATIIDCTLDVSDSVRKAAYCVLANKFPLQSLSIKQRTIILQRGLADRSLSVTKECLKLMKDEWLVNCCNGDPMVLLKFLDVETYESVGEAVMGTLLKAGMVNVQGQSMQQFLVLSSDANEVEIFLTGKCMSITLMEAEVALYWRTVCKHLQTEAQARGSDAAATTGTEATVYAAEASDNNDLLERVLPATLADYVELVKAHLAAGPNYRFTSRQLLLLGVMLDFSDATNRKVASAFVQELLHRPLEQEVDEDGNKVIIGDGINHGGDREWATAVSELAKRVHASTGEFEEVVVAVVEELARPCRERTADFMHWMHCLAVTGLLLENIKSLRCLQGRAIEPAEILHSLLLPGAKHVHLDVQRVALRCLGLYGLLERKPSEELVKQLRNSLVNSSSPVSIMASKALVDLGMWHGPQEVDRVMGNDVLSQPQDDKRSFTPVNLSDTNGDLRVELLDLLYAVLDRDICGEPIDTDDHESIQAILGEGFAKILLLSENYPSISVSLHHLLLAKLIKLYFSNEAEDLHRLKQCLSVFFEHYPALSADHKASNTFSIICISKAFIPVTRSMWPGIYGNAGGSSFVVSNLRKRATQASRFMLQMMQAPLYSKETETEEEHGSKKSSESAGGDFENGEEGLAIRIGAEVASFPTKKTSPEKSYISGLCKIAVLLQFRTSEQGAIKCMRGLLNHMAESVSTEKELVKELKQMAARLKALDKEPDQEFSQDQVDHIFGRLELETNVGVDVLAAELPTPAPRSTRPARSRRRVKRDNVSSDEDETSPISVVHATPSAISTRSQRASKTAALSKMTTKTAIIFEEDDDEDDENESDATSEEESDELSE
ncbi:Nuclear condensin complex subunit 3 [Macleaya cordata]|uniref:Nuclear condensin complex subunit 3 n=1 Tax=Macleaya cordata TaxID=56857 RepID=A0A200PUJ5_MACCD|nr:Nuclear condensin complex subunit 3 [Macleaya cordata]